MYILESKLSELRKHGGNRKRAAIEPCLDISGGVERRQVWSLEVELGIVTAGRERTVVDRPFAFGTHLLNVECAGTRIGAQRLQLLLGFRIMIIVRLLKRPFVTDSLVFAEIDDLAHPDVSVKHVRALHCDRKADYASPA